MNPAKNPLQTLSQTINLVFVEQTNKDKEERRMSTTMDQIHHIREMFYQQDKNISEIASETGLNWKTVKKYVDMDTKRRRR